MGWQSRSARMQADGAKLGADRENDDEYAGDSSYRSDCGSVRQLAITCRRPGSTQAGLMSAPDFAPRDFTNVVSVGNVAPCSTPRGVSVHLYSARKNSQVRAVAHLPTAFRSNSAHSNSDNLLRVPPALRAPDSRAGNVRAPAASFQ